MNEVIGIIGARRGGWSVSQIFEALCLTDDRVIVARTAQGGVFGGGSYTGLRNKNSLVFQLNNF